MFNIERFGKEGVQIVNTESEEDRCVLTYKEASDHIGPLYRVWLQASDGVPAFTFNTMNGTALTAREAANAYCREHDKSTGTIPEGFVSSRQEEFEQECVVGSPDIVRKNVQLSPVLGSGLAARRFNKKGLSPLSQRKETRGQASSGAATLSSAVDGLTLGVEDRGEEGASEGKWTAGASGGKVTAKHELRPPSERPLHGNDGAVARS